MPPAARKTPAPRKPQDHKPKATKPDGFTFDATTVEDVIDKETGLKTGTKVVTKTHTLPHPSAALAKIPGKAFRDAMLDGEIGELKFALVCVEAVDAAPATLDALYAKPTDEMLTILGKWMSSADMSGATLPQS